VNGLARPAAAAGPALWGSLPVARVGLGVMRLSRPCGPVPVASRDKHKHAREQAAADLVGWVLWPDRAGVFRSGGSARLRAAPAGQHDLPERCFQAEHWRARPSAHAE